MIVEELAAADLHPEVVWGNATDSSDLRWLACDVIKSADKRRCRGEHWMG